MYIVKVVKSLKKYKFLLIEAGSYSLLYEIYLRLNVYSPLKPLHDTPPAANKISHNTLAQISPSEHPTLLKVSKLMRILERRAFWKPKCYNRALTAKKLLARRKIGSSLEVGFRIKDNTYDGHAWLMHKGHFVTGKVKHIEKFKVLKPS